MEPTFAALSDGMKRILKGLTAYHSAARNYGSGGYFTDDNQQSISMDIKPSATGDKLVEHPVVCTHSETSDKSLFVNPIYTECFKDCDERGKQAFAGLSLCPCRSVGIPMRLHMDNWDGGDLG